ncbi:ubiquitin fusion degradation protein, partial [Coemansia sp. RSA 2708]
YEDSDDETGMGIRPFDIPSAHMFHRGYTGRRRQFKRFYSAYPVAVCPGNKMEANYGGKIFLPASALDELSQLEVVYPLLFKLQNDEEETDNGRRPRTHCGVLEFTAEEGRVYLPQWMMETLHLTPGSPIEVINVALLQGSLVKLQPQSVDFLDISDHRAVLETALRRFSALTVGDLLTIEYNSREYSIKVLETQPSPSAINIVETDLSVDFAPPVGYVEPTAQSSAGSSVASSSMIAKDIRQKEDAAKSEAASLRFQAFRGAGTRLSSAADKLRPASLRSYASTGAESDEPTKRQEADEETPVPLDLPIGTLYFGYRLVPPPGSESKDVDPSNPDDKDGFQGEGRVLRQRRKR